jgi:hypothetical protein
VNTTAALARATVPIFLLASLAAAEVPSSYRELARHGIVSGFGMFSGNPATTISRIPAIDRPDYIPVDEARLRDDDLCVGIERQGIWHFAPLFILNSHEIVNHHDAPAIAYCPLAGLSIAIDGRTYISGLLRWDAFVLYDPDTDSLILPFDQRSLDGERQIAFEPLELLTFAGVRHRFPDARILSPSSHHGNRSQYGDYPRNRQLGLGHPKPGLRGTYDARSETIHPKEQVLIVGTATKMMKAYPFSTLEEATDGGRKTMTDQIDGVEVVLSYDPEFRHAQVTAETDALQARAFSYYFALRQHLPDLPVYSVPE